MKQTYCTCAHPLISSKAPDECEECGGQVIRCDLCDRHTPYTNTRRCNRCWELEGRMRDDPALALRILAKQLAERIASQTDAEAKALRDASPEQYKARCHETALDADTFALFVMQNAEEIRKGDRDAFERFWCSDPNSEQRLPKFVDLVERLVFRYIIRFDIDEDLLGEEPNTSGNVPVGICPKCQTPIYTQEGFCGTCEPNFL